MNEIRTAYRRAALTTHPDKDGGSADAFHAVTLAFDILSCRSTRKCYDKAHATLLGKRARSIRREASKRHATRKRPASCAALKGTKRQRTAAGKQSISAAQTSNIPKAMEQLQMILQSMSAEVRRSSISRMPMAVRNVLLKFMAERSDSSNASPLTPRKYPSLRCKKKRSVCGSRLRPIKNTYGLSYSAQVDIGLLRLYTRGVRDIEKAIEHQLVLSQVRDVLYSADEESHEVWNNAGEVEQIIEDVLRKTGSSEEELGLRACVQMRATAYVERKHVMTSPAMSFRKVLPLRNRLVCARRESWDRFRAQWVNLMRSTRNARSKDLSQEDAETLCDEARKEFLEKQLALALRNTVRMLKAEEQKASKTSKGSPQEKHRLLRDFVKAQTTRDAREMWKTRMKLLLQRDVYEDELQRYPK